MAHGMQFICGSEYRYAIRRVSIIQPFLEKSILFLTLYFSLLMVACTRIKEKFFSPLGNGWTASAKLLLSCLNMTPYTRATYHITRLRSKHFQNGRRLSVKKNL